MTRYAMVRASSGRVENVLEWSGETTMWQPPAGRTLVESETANIGDVWDGSTFTPDPTPAAPDPLAGARAEVRKLMGPKTPPSPIDNFLTADNGTATAAQRDAVAKQVIESFRALVRIARSELAE